MTTVTGLFDDYQDAADAVSELEAIGVPRDDISIVANNAGDQYRQDKTSDAGEDAAAGAGLGALVGGAGGLLTGLGIMAYAMTLHESGLEPAFTILGVAVLALGHRLNMMAKQPAF